MKDIPDIKGDKEYNINTFSVKLGPKVILKVCVGLLYLMYAGAGIVFWMGMRGWMRWVVLGMHLGVVGWLRRMVRGVGEEGDPKGVYGLYMNVWKLFYVEYLILPFAAL